MLGTVASCSHLGVRAGHCTACYRGPRLVTALVASDWQCPDGSRHECSDPLACVPRSGSQLPPPLHRFMGVLLADPNAGTRPQGQGRSQAEAQHTQKPQVGLRGQLCWGRHRCVLTCFTL